MGIRWIERLPVPEGGFFLHTPSDNRDKLSRMIRVKVGLPVCRGRLVKVQIAYPSRGNRGGTYVRCHE
jgi:hypothetical protein